MSRCVVQAEDGRYMYNYSVWYEWGPDLQKARVFRSRGHAELSCRRAVHKTRKCDGPCQVLSIKNVKIEEA